VPTVHLVGDRTPEIRQQQQVIDPPPPPPRPHAGVRLGHHVLGVNGVAAQHESEAGQRLAVRGDRRRERIVDHPGMSHRASAQRSRLHHRGLTDIPTHRHLDDELAEQVPSRPVGGFHHVDAQG